MHCSQFGEVLAAVSGAPLLLLLLLLCGELWSFSPQDEAVAETTNYTTLSLKAAPGRARILVLCSCLVPLRTPLSCFPQTVKVSM